MKTLISESRAFSLVEVTVAIGVAGFCLIAIFGLLPVGLRSNQAAVEQTVANGILSSVAADLRATPATIPPGRRVTTGNFELSIPANPVTEADASSPVTLYLTSDGQSSASSTADSRYRLTVKYVPNMDAKAATLVNLKISWPAIAAPANAAGMVQTFVALDRN